MSYDIRLKDAATGETVNLAEPHQMTGGTYCLGGTTELWLNVTYNYSKHFHRVFPKRAAREDDVEFRYEDKTVGGVRFIYGLSGRDSAPLLDAAIAQLGDDVDDDYWKPTEGNARAALVQLRAMAELAPEAIWEGD